eukprot:1146058-Rhodomonas_salina.2
MMRLTPHCLCCSPPRLALHRRAGPPTSVDAVACSLRLIQTRALFASLRSSWRAAAICSVAPDRRSASHIQA